MNLLNFRTILAEEQTMVEASINSDLILFGVPGTRGEPGNIIFGVPCPGNSKSVGTANL